MMRSTCGFLTLSAFIAFTSPAQANSIVNGGFENPDIAAGTFSVFAAIPGWTTTFGSGIEIQDHIAGSPYEGNQFAELDSFSNSGMIQTIIGTIPGAPYTLSFAYSPRPGRPNTTNGIEVYFGGQLLDTLQMSGVGLANTSWTLFNYSVTASGATSAIEFRAIGASDSLGGYLDSVSFEAAAVPESSVLPLLSTGILALATMMFAMAGQHRP